MIDRLKELRKNILKLSQKQFAEKLNITQAGLSKIELSGSVLTERNIKTICSIFNVSEEWLRYGTGEVFVNKDDDPLEHLKLDSLERTILQTYLSFDDKDRAVIKEYLKNFTLNYIKNNDFSNSSTNDNTFLAVAHDKNGKDNKEYVNLSDEQLNNIEKATDLSTNFDKK